MFLPVVWKKYTCIHMHIYASWFKSYLWFSSEQVFYINRAQVGKEALKWQMVTEAKEDNCGKYQILNQFKYSHQPGLVISDLYRGRMAFF